MYTTEYSKFLLSIFILLLIKLNMILTDNSEDSNRYELIYCVENSHVRLTCDLNDVAWWKRPNLLATRYGIILPKYRSKVYVEKTDDGTKTSGIQLSILNIRHIQSNDSGTYECETLGAIRQFNLTVTVNLTTVELGAQILSPSDSSIIHPSNQTDKNLLHQSSSSSHFLFNSLSLNNGQISLRENQLIRLTCVVPRALPAAYIVFPFNIEHRVEKNTTVLNDDKTYRTVVVILIRIDRQYHKHTFHCEAIQSQYIYDDDNKQHQVRSNKVQMDVVYGPTCSHKPPLTTQFFTGIRRSTNLTCFMNDGNPSIFNFSWILPSGNTRLGYNLNSTSSYITVTPNQGDDFGQVTCRAYNKLGLFGECHVKIIMGGVPDPIESCHYTYLNATLTVNCLAGFHQGDEDFFCYMYKRQENGSYSEHARLKGNCAFILPDLKPEKHHDFRVFTKNKFGDNFDKSYSIAVGKPRVESLVEKTRLYWPYMAICVIGACLISLLIICCCCYHIRRSIYKRKTKGNFDNLTYQNHSSHSNSNGKQSFDKKSERQHNKVHLKENGNETTYPVRPYRSKDYLVSADSSTLPRNNPSQRNAYTTENEIMSPRRSNLKETDLDQLLTTNNSTGSLATATIKTLPINRNRPLFSAFGQPMTDEIHRVPLPIQRRSSFQTATKLNTLDFYTLHEPFYLADRHLMKTNRRDNYSPERDLRDREQYREKRREYSPFSKDDRLADMHRENLIDRNASRDNSLIVENRMLLTNEQLSIASSANDQQWREMNAIDEMDYQDRYIDSTDDNPDDYRDDNRDDNDQFNRADDDRDQDRASLGRVSIDYQRDDDTTFANYDRNDDRNDDRYRDDGIFV